MDYYRQSIEIAERVLESARLISQQSQDILVATQLLNEKKSTPIPISILESIPRPITISTPITTPNPIPISIFDSITVPISISTPIPIPIAIADHKEPDILVHVHAHNWFLWPELEQDLVRAMGDRAYQLIVTLPIDRVEEMWKREEERAEILEAHPTAVVIIMENRGMDPGGLLCALHYLKRKIQKKQACAVPFTVTETGHAGGDDTVDCVVNENITRHDTTLRKPIPDVATGSGAETAKSTVIPALPYRFILKLHTKTLTTWRREMIDPILGTKELFSRCIGTISNEAENIGMVGAKKWCIQEDIGSRDVQNAIVLALMGGVIIESDRPHLFVGGTTFLARFEPLWNWAWNMPDLREYIVTNMPMGREIAFGPAYTLERMFCMICGPSVGLRLLGV